MNRQGTPSSHTVAYWKSQCQRLANPTRSCLPERPWSSPSIQAIATAVGCTPELDGEIALPKTLTVSAIRQRELDWDRTRISLPAGWLAQCPKTLCGLLGENCPQQLRILQATVSRCAYGCQSGAISPRVFLVRFKPTP